MENDFNFGMKVSLNNEFGVVIKVELDKLNFCGVIRWDTSKENDIEDWRGQFGAFVNIGGKILNDNYSFRFINDDGSLKQS
ncbi:hypothetical protein [Flavobacterium anhuiense]|uniref:hypothetical protein n=1 Tax=Flavobacterium anhuiense TaxID=459526 RepID=UPI003D999626